VREEANGILRSLIERVVLVPGGEGAAMQAILHGNLARILAFCEGAADSKKRPAADAGGVSCTSVVAGAGFEPATFRL
jgi:site-specific DNA recombinase